VKEIHLQEGNILLTSRQDEPITPHQQATAMLMSEAWELHWWLPRLHLTLKCCGQCLQQLFSVVRISVLHLTLVYHSLISPMPIIKLKKSDYLFDKSL
jgi:hypothetical protein